MKKIVTLVKNFIAKDFLWKMISLFGAVILWFIVMNTLDPTEVKSFSTNITFTNESVLTERESPVMITNQKEIEEARVVIKVKGTRPALDELSRPENREAISAYIDLKQLSKVDFDNQIFPFDESLVITPKLPENIFLYSYEIVSCSPNTEVATFDSVKSETRKLHLNVGGEVKSGYNASTPQYDSDTVTITGPAGMYSKISEVRADIDVTGKTGDLSFSVAPAVYDKDGNKMELFKVDPAVIDVTMSINKEWELPVKEPETTGEINENLVLESIEYEPKSVSVEGTIEDINKVPEITVPAVALASIEHTQTFTYDIRPSLKDTQLKIKDGSPTEVKVTVTVTAKASRDVTLKQEDFTVSGLASGLAADIETVNITIYGPQAVLDGIKAKDLKPVLDLTDKKEGWYNLPYTITLPDKADVRVTPSAAVVVRDSNSKPPQHFVPETTTETTTETLTETTETTTAHQSAKNDDDKENDNKTN